MKKIILAIAAISTLSLGYAQTLDRSIRPKPGPTPVIKIADAETFTLPNGLKVFVVENHKLPSVTYSIQLDVYPNAEGDKAGLSGLVGELITSGTKTLSKDAFNEAVDGIGANIGAGGKAIYGQALTKHQDQLLSLMSDMILNPNFQQKELDKLEKQSIGGLNNNINDPDFMSSNITSAVTYGPNHPYGETTTPQSIKNITLNDCKQYFNTYFRPNVAYMAVVGDVTLEEVKQLVTKYFSKWQKADVPVTTYPTAYAPAQNQVSFGSRPGAVQSVVTLTYPLVLKPGSPDIMKINVLNAILGGSDQGRLFMNLRETHGWTYGAYSSISPDPIVGSFEANFKCRTAVTDSAIAETLNEMQKIRDNKVSDEDLKNKKQYLAGLFALGLERPQTIAQYAINIDRYNMPKDYYKTYLDRLSAVTAIDVWGAAKRYIAPHNVNIIVAGNPTELDKLKRFSADSTILFYDAFGKQVQSTESKVINGVTVNDVINKYINAIGGKTAIESLKDLTIYADVSGRQPYTISQKTITPNMFAKNIKVVQRADASSIAMQNSATNRGDGRTVGTQQNLSDINIVAYDQKIVIKGDKGYIKAQGKRTDLTPNGIKEYQDDADLQALLHPDQNNVSYALLGETVDNGVDCYTVEKGADDGKKKIMQYYAKNTGLLVKEIITTQTADGPKATIKSYSDYKEVKGGNGYKIPFTTQVLDPNPSTISVNSAKANTGLTERDIK